MTVASRPHRAVSVAMAALLLTAHADRVRADLVRRGVVEPVGGQHGAPLAALTFDECTRGGRW